MTDFSAVSLKHRSKTRTRAALGVSIAGLLAAVTGGQAFAQGAPAVLQAEREVRGTLASTDSVLASDQSYYDTYRLNVREGQRIRVRMNSSAFAPYLVVGPNVDDACEQCEIGVADDRGRAEVTYIASVSGTVDVRANSQAGGATGNYTLLAEVLPEPSLVTEQIRFGVPFDSRLAETDITNDEGQSRRAFTVRLRGGQPVRVAVSGFSNIDPVITVKGPDGADIGENDDGGPGLDARVDFTPERSGLYTIEVAGLEPGKTGPISVLVSAPPKPAAVSYADLVADVEAESVLDDSTPAVEVDGDPVRAGRHQFPIRSGTLYVVEAASGSFDSFLEVQQVRGEEVVATESDDDSGGELNARLRFRAQTDGVARVAVTSLNGEGTYVVRYREYQPTPAPARGELLAVGASVSGQFTDASPTRLLDGDSTQVREAPFAAYEVQLAQGQAITIRLNRTSEASELDPLVMVGTGTPGNFEKLGEDDDSGSGLNARLNFTAPAAGTYVILATTFAESTGDEFRIEVLPFVAGAVTASRAAAVGTPVTGQLSATDRITSGDDDGTTGHLYEFAAEAGAIYVIEAKSDDFDTTLALSGAAAGGEILQSDDDGGEGTNSRLVFKVEAAGQYYLTLASFDETSTGDYTLSIRTGTEADLEQAESEGVDVLAPAVE
jgi:sulfur carrier protein ThiS